MKKSVKSAVLGFGLWAVGMSLCAQVADEDSVRRSQDDSSDFTFTESQLDDDNDAAQTVSSILSSSSDPYLSEVGYRFSPMRFKVRAYDNMYQQNYMNGLMLNDLEQGRFSYGMIGGMNDATRNQESADAFEFNNFSFTGIGGATHINTRASAFAAGNKVTLSGTNRNYILRGMYTHATGWLDNGWAFAGTVGYRWSKEGVIEGTFYNSFSYLLSAEKRFDGGHSLSLVTFGSPTERAQQGASTEEAYWLANSHYYNPYWGYQDGKKRNSRVVRDFEPTFIATWDWKVDNDKKLTTAAGFKYSMYSNTALSYANNAYNPAPDYYKNFPSSIFNVYDSEINDPDYLADHPYYLDQYETLKDYWGVKANRQIDWDKLYYVNSIQNEKGETASYYQERRHNDQMMISLSPTWTHTINTMHKYAAGLVLNHTKGMHYKTMQDMLGAENYIDIDTYAERDYGKGSEEVQNDLRNPNRKISEGDRFGYDYNIFVNKAKLWGQYQYSGAKTNLFAGAYTEGTTLEREGKMQNGRAKDYSYGKSGAAKFLGYGAKAELALRPFANNRIAVGVSYDAQAPLSRNAFVAPRVQNNFVNGLTLERILGANLAWTFRFGELTGKLSGYYTRFNDQVEQTAFYNDLDSRFYYVTMSGLNKEHYGFDGALKYQVNSELSFNVLASIGEAKYINNPDAQLFSENNSSEYKQWVNPANGEVMQDKIFADGMRVSGTPLTALGVGVNYNINNWYLELNLNYYDRAYLGFSTYRRMGYVLSQTNNKTASVDQMSGMEYFEMTDAEKMAFEEEGGVLYYTNGDIAKVYSPKQEKLNGGFMLDASIGKFIRLNGGRAISINLSLQNITNNRNLQTGGFEQNRSDYYADGDERGNSKTYKFSKNPKYYYANAFNAFLNINYRF